MYRAGGSLSWELASELGVAGGFQTSLGPTCPRATGSWCPSADAGSQNAAGE